MLDQIHFLKLSKKLFLFVLVFKFKIDFYQLDWIANFWPVKMNSKNNRDFNLSLFVFRKC